MLPDNTSENMHIRSVFVFFTTISHDAFSFIVRMPSKKVK